MNRMRGAYRIGPDRRSTVHASRSVCSRMSWRSHSLGFEPDGMMILIGASFILPLLGAQLGIDLNVVWQLVQRSTNVIIDLILWLTGNT